jgi:hypothetical protein
MTEVIQLQIDSEAEAAVIAHGVALVAVVIKTALTRGAARELLGETVDATLLAFRSGLITSAAVGSTLDKVEKLADVWIARHT